MGGGGVDRHHIAHPCERKGALICGSVYGSQHVPSGGGFVVAFKASGLPIHAVQIQAKFIGQGWAIPTPRDPLLGFIC